MPQYFFDILTDGELIPDEEGISLPSLNAARREASRSLADLLRDIIRTEHPPSLTISVRDSEGPVFETCFEWHLETVH